MRGQGCEASEQRAAQAYSLLTPKRGVSGRNGYEATPGVSPRRDRRELDKGVGRMRWPRPCEEQAAQGFLASVLATSHWLDGEGGHHTHTGSQKMSLWNPRFRATSDKQQRRATLELARQGNPCDWLRPSRPLLTTSLGSSAVSCRVAGGDR